MGMVIYFTYGEFPTQFHAELYHIISINSFCFMLNTLLAPLLFHSQYISWRYFTYASHVISFTYYYFVTVRFPQIMP